MVVEAAEAAAIVVLAGAEAEEVEALVLLVVAAMEKEEAEVVVEVALQVEAQGKGLPYQPTNPFSTSSLSQPWHSHLEN
jgi:hypothetical protein